MVPYGRGGNGFTVLDVTNPDKPLHLYSIYNDHIKNKVFVMNHLDVVSEYEYIDDNYSVIDMEESKTVADNYNNNNSIDDECKADTTTSCYESRTWTFPVPGLTKADFETLPSATHPYNPPTPVGPLGACRDRIRHAGRLPTPCSDK